MHTTEHTDLDGDALTVHRDKGLAWVTITRDGDELTVGPVPAHALTGQHRGSHTRDEKRNAESCPLTPDAITDEMVERAADRFRELDLDHEISEMDLVRGTIIAALAEPPARPEGAEDIEDLLADWFGENDDPDQSNRDLADYLVRKGVRVVGEDDGGDETPDVCPHVGGPGGDCGCPL